MPGQKQVAIKDDFSVGLSLKEISAHTTDENWEKVFFDRTLEENKAKPLLKLL